MDEFVSRLTEAGFDARGVEPSEGAAAAARARGAPVERVTVEELDLAAASLDAVVVWHVLEHLRDPAGTLAGIARWLRPGGRVVVACPNLASLQARIGGDRWFHQDVPRHLTHFTAIGLRLLLERSGFRLERVSHVVVEQNPLGMWQTLLNRITAHPNVAFRALKRDLDGGSGLGRDLALTAIAGPLLGAGRDRARAGGRTRRSRRERRGGGPARWSHPGVVSLASVIVPTVVGGPRIRGLLSSIRDRPSEVEVLVVDNSSPDPEIGELGRPLRRGQR